MNNVIIFGATGMVGTGVMRECLQDPDVETVLAIGRSPVGIPHPKLRDLVRTDLSTFEDIADELHGFDACFFCLGVSSNSVDEANYQRITYGYTLAAATTLSRISPRMVFVYVSGAGTDSSEKGILMWARVKGATENALLKLPFAGAYMFRPGLIQPMDGIVSRTKSYRVIYTITKPILPLLRGLFPNSVLTTRQIGKAMLNVARFGYPKPILESADIRAASHT